MEYKKYKPTFIWIGIAAGPLLLMLVFFLSSLHDLSNLSGFDNTLGAFLVPTLLVILILYPLGRTVKIDAEKICHIDFFIFRKCLYIKDIKYISYPMTFGIGNENRTLTIVAKDGAGSKKLTLPHPAFDKKVLAQIAKDLMVQNPEIEIDNDTQGLIDNNSSTAF